MEELNSQAHSQREKANAKAKKIKNSRKRPKKKFKHQRKFSLLRSLSLVNRPLNSDRWTSDIQLNVPIGVRLYWCESDIVSRSFQYGIVHTGTKAKSLPGGFEEKPLLFTLNSYEDQ